MKIIIIIDDQLLVPMLYMSYLTYVLSNNHGEMELRKAKLGPPIPKVNSSRSPDFHWEPNSQIHLFLKDQQSGQSKNVGGVSSSVDDVDYLASPLILFDEIKTTLHHLFILKGYYETDMLPLIKHT